MKADEPSQGTPELGGKRGTTNYRVHPSVLLISAAEAAELLSVSERLLWSLANRNAIPSLTIGRRRLYRPCALEAWIAAGCPTEPNAANSIGKGVAS